MRAGNTFGGYVVPGEEGKVNAGACGCQSEREFAWLNELRFCLLVFIFVGELQNISSAKVHHITRAAFRSMSPPHCIFFMCLSRMKHVDIRTHVIVTVSRHARQLVANAIVWRFDFLFFC